jgi:FkbM family methyltransferase
MMARPAPLGSPSIPRSRPPGLFRLARELARRRAPGGYRLIDVARRLGLLERVVRYGISEGVTLDVPIGRTENAWDLRDVMGYQPQMVDDLVGAVESMAAPVTFVDGGADIGLVSVLVAARCGDRLASVVAIEPNGAAFEVLQVNLDRLPCPADALRGAVSDFTGQGRLETPAYDDSAHASFLVRAADGEIPVFRIDDLGVAPGVRLVMKLDVEGEELAAIRGARATLERAAGFAVSFEAHEDVARRTGVDPIEAVRYLDEIRPCAVSISELPGHALTTDRPFFDQVSLSRPIGVSVLCRAR